MVKVKKRVPNTAQVIGHNYVVNAPIYNPKRQIDSQEGIDQDYSLDYFISTNIQRDLMVRVKGQKMCTKRRPSYWP